VTELSSTQTKLSLPPIPAQVWKRSGRPLQARMIQVLLPCLLLVIALFIPSRIVTWALIAAAILLFFSLPWLTDSLLRPLSQQVDKVQTGQASALLTQLRNRRRVQWFAPHGWKSLQEAQIHLRKNDAKAAALAFAETARLMQTGKHEVQPELTSNEAHAWLLAGEYIKTRDLLANRASSGKLTLLDELNLAIVSLLVGTGSKQEALSQVQRIHEQVGEHPRVLAALAVAFERCGEPQKAFELLETAQINGQDSLDELTQILIKRAQKMLRSYILAQKKRQRKAEQIEQLKQVVEPPKQTKYEIREAKTRTKKQALKQQKRKQRKAQNINPPIETRRAEKAEISAKTSEIDAEKSKQNQAIASPLLKSPTPSAFSPNGFIPTKVASPAPPPPAKPSPLSTRIVPLPPKVNIPQTKQLSIKAPPPPPPIRKPINQAALADKTWDEVLDETDKA